MSDSDGVNTSLAISLSLRIKLRPVGVANYVGCERYANTTNCARYARTYSFILVSDSSWIGFAEYARKATRLLPRDEAARGIFAALCRALISVNMDAGSQILARAMTNYRNCKCHYISQRRELAIRSVFPRIEKRPPYRSSFRKFHMQITIYIGRVNDSVNSARYIFPDALISGER